MLNSSFTEVFWPTFWATIFGVLLSVAFSVIIWFLGRWYTDRGNRKRLKDGLVAELRVNLIRLRQIQETITKALSKGIVLGQFSPYYMDLNIYNTALTAGHIRLFTPLLQGKVHGVASNMQRFNVLLANVEAFAIHNPSLPSFKDELKLRCSALTKQAEAFANKIEETLVELGISLESNEHTGPSLQVVDGVTSVDNTTAHSAVLKLTNEGDTPGEIGIRAKGDETYQTYHLEPGAQVSAIVPLVEGKFQAKVSDPSCRIYLKGYITV